MQEKKDIGLWITGRKIIKPHDPKLSNRLARYTGPMVSVDHGGKLFERINANEPADIDKRYRNTKPRHSTFVSEFLPTPRQPSGQGVFRIAGLGSFVAFLAHQEKQK